jgi:hypothetical protein
MISTIVSGLFLLTFPMPMFKTTDVMFSDPRPLLPISISQVTFTKQFWGVSLTQSYPYKISRPSPSSSTKFKSRPPLQDASTGNDVPIASPDSFAAEQAKVVVGGDAMEKVSPLSKGP